MKDNKDNSYLMDEDISKTQRLELERYQKYLKSIKKYDPFDEEEYLYLTTEMENIIQNNEDLSDIEVLELTKKLEKIENTKDYTTELLELTKEIKHIIKPNKSQAKIEKPKKKLEIPKVEKKQNPRKLQVQSMTSTSLIPKINGQKRKNSSTLKKVSVEKNKPNKQVVTFKDLVDKNIKEDNEFPHFDTEAIQRIRVAATKPVLKKSNKKSKLVWSFVFGISLCCFAFLVIRFLKWSFENISIQTQIDNIYSMANVSEVVSDGAVTNVEDKIVEIPTPEVPQDARLNDYWYYMSMSMLNVNFDELKAINNEVAGWVQVAGTNVNYPYAHTTDNKYYLKHSFDKSYNSAGWVFLDYRNNKEEFGRNNILYAHGRIDNTMFGSLKKIVTPAWYNNSNNHVVKISTPKENTLWQVFSVYTILPESYYIKTKFSDEQFDKFLNTITSRSVHDFKVEVDTKDKVLTLSTCYDESLRVVLHAKLIRTEEK